jgi:hypothetical protein
MYSPGKRRLTDQVDASPAGAPLAEGKRTRTQGLVGPSAPEPVPASTMPVQRRAASESAPRHEASPPVPGGLAESAEELLDARGCADNADQPPTERATDTSPGGDLPRDVRGELETALGTDLGGVRIHDDSAAAKRAEHHDAHAIAEGQDIYFGAGAYDPGSAGGRLVLAHEVAHTVQARGTQAVAARSRTTSPTEGAELEAEHFAADFARRGVNARTELRERLDAGAVARVGIEGIVPEPPRSRAPIAEPEGATAAQWLARFGDTLAVLVAAHLERAVYPTGHPRLRWIEGPDGFPVALWREIAFAAGPELYTALERMLAPADIAALIDEHRPLGERARSEGQRVGPLDWTPAVALALVGEFDRRAMASLARVGPRVVAAIDGLAVSTGADEVSGPRETSLLAPGQVTPSHPMDTTVIQTLSAIAVAEVMPAVASPTPATAASSLRRVRYAWHDDPHLWNWIRVAEPADASLEEVAQAALGSAEQAYRIQGAAPFFALPPDVAAQQAPARAQAALATSTAEAAGPFAAVRAGVAIAQGARGDALAASGSGDEAALTQADRTARQGVPTTPTTTDEPGAGDTRDEGPRGTDAGADRAQHCQVQLAVMIERYADLGVGPLLAPALVRLATRQARQPALPNEERARFGVLFDAQAAILHEVIGELEALHRHAECQRIAAQREITAATIEATTAGPVLATPPLDVAASPEVVELAHAYAGAAAISDLPELARERLDEVRARRATLALDIFAAQLADARRSLAAARPELPEHGPPSFDDSRTAIADDVSARQDALGEELLAAQRAGAAGAEVDTERLRERARAVQLEAQIVRSYSHLSHIDALLLKEMESPVALVAGQKVDLGRARTRLIELREGLQWALNAWRGRMVASDFEATIGMPTSRPGGDGATVASLEADLTGLGTAEVQEALGYAYEQLRDMAIAHVIVDVALLIGVSVVSAGVVGMAGAAARGVWLGRAGAAAAELSTGARWVGGVAQFVGEAGLNAVGQTALQDGDAGAAFAENLLADAATLAALRPLRRAFEAWGAADDAAMSLWQKVGRGGKWALREGAEISAMGIAGATSSYLVHRWRAGDRPADAQTAMDWALQGASIAVGKFVHSRLRGVQQRLDELAQIGGVRVGSIALRRCTRATLEEADAIQESGDPSGALEVLAAANEINAEEIRLLESLASDPKALAAAGLHPGAIAEQVARVRAESSTVSEAGFATLPLRLAGLEEIVPGAVWTGTSEDIAIALHQAERLDIPVKVHGHDVAARRWDVRLGEETLAIHEKALVGRPREPKADIGPADAEHAQQYARAAKSLQQRHEEYIKADLESREVVEVDHVQVGHSIAGVINQSTLPTGAGLADRLVIYRDPGTLSDRGDLPLGQRPDAIDAPGMRVSEQTADRDRYATSRELGAALDIGRFEVQVPAYRADVVGLERRPETPGNDWKAPHRAMRVRVRNAEGERWIYVDRLDYTGGAGPPKWDAAREATNPGDGNRPSDFDILRSSGLLLSGDDPALARKIKPGAERILAWGSTATGAWAAEDAVAHGVAHVDLMGDVPPGAKPAFFEKLKAAAESGDPAAIERAQAEYEKAAHKGRDIERNRRPGAAYDNPRVLVEEGSPNHLAPTTDGRVRVTFGSGDTAEVRIYDQVILSHGQNAQEKGGHDVILGDPNAAAGVQLKPIYDERGLLVGLESIDPPGIQLKGAAYAKPELAPWIHPDYRDKFDKDVRKLGADGHVTHTGHPISADSRGVGGGIEMMADAIPLANEALARASFQIPSHRNKLKLAHEQTDQWDDQLAAFLVENLRGHPDRVRVQRLDDSGPGLVEFRVWVGAMELGRAKVSLNTPVVHSEHLAIDQP